MRLRHVRARQVISPNRVDWTAFLAEPYPRTDYVVVGD